MYIQVKHVSHILTISKILIFIQLQQCLLLIWFTCAVSLINFVLAPYAVYIKVDLQHRFVHWTAFPCWSCLSYFCFKPLENMTRKISLFNESYAFLFSMKNGRHFLFVPCVYNIWWKIIYCTTPFSPSNKTLPDPTTSIRHMIYGIWSGTFRIWFYDTFLKYLSVFKQIYLLRKKMLFCAN
jgi:hypothetical protein